MTAEKKRDAETDDIQIIPREAGEDSSGTPGGAAPDPLAAKQREYDALYDKYIRLLADFDNYKKLAAREREQYLQYGHEELLKEWLPVLDNIERALHHAEGHRAPDAVVQGWALILKQCLDVLGRAGVTVVETKGKPFNPEWHQAIAQKESSQEPDGLVVEEAQRGYLLKGKLLRPALVTVSKASTAKRPGGREDKSNDAHS
ncbi:MAG TPA: nucleotide exchange factor GrpE [Nitrospiria bacterium]|nr:nucleotide exchange factor GrpE [Nitrospiria bacterium]